ncbi:MAG: flagellar motor protein MotB [Sphingomonadaceae bacterium]|nr:OmpA family protein [Sphingomonadaceae bacterium]
MAAKRGKNEPPPPPIIVKKVTVVEGGHHGGAWKVAYADFVTAMMAFFLLLWLLGATTEDQRKGLADYFTPTLVKIREGKAGSDGLMGGASLTDVDDYPHRQGQTGTKTLTIPRDATGGPMEGAGKIKRVEKMRERLQEELAENRRLARLAKNLRMVNTTEGIRIDLVDDADFSMFAMGTTILTSDAQELVGVIAQMVGPEGGELTIRGHTDSLPWKDGVRGNNWSLSASRAEATRQALIRQGVGAKRFNRIEGVADRELLIEDNPQDPRNRRISILLLD